MLDEKQKENTVKIVGAINTVLISECQHSFLVEHMIAHSGENCNRNRVKYANFCFEKL